MRYRSKDVFSLRKWTSCLPTGLACPAVLYAAYHHRLRGFHPLWLCFPAPSTWCFLRCGLLRFRSPLLAESFLFLRVLRCFSSPGSLGCDYFIHRTIRRHAPTWVSPFGYLRFLRLHTPHRSFSQCIASFIGVFRQGIHRMPL